MALFKIVILSAVIGLYSCTTKGQEPDNTKAMYGEVSKSSAHNVLDEEFINGCLEQFITIDSSVYVHVDLAWRYFYHNELKTAMKRFNQVWLLNADYPDAYFGFAALMDMQGNVVESARFYKIGVAKDVTNERAKVCYQRIAVCKEQLKILRG